MTSDLKYLHNQTIFVDANAILYHLSGLSPTAKAVFGLAGLNKLRLITTTRMIDEVIHKTLLIRARDQFGINSKVASGQIESKSTGTGHSGDLSIHSYCSFEGEAHYAA